MKSLITGGTGFLGRNLAWRLADMGQDVIVTGRNRKAGEDVAGYSPKIEFRPAAIDDVEAVMALCEGVDTVFHAAALASPWGYYQDFYKANVIGTQNVIDGCRKHHVKRLVNVSTPAIYYNGHDRFNVKEDAELPNKFACHYAATKYVAEQAVTAANGPDLETLSIRPRGLFGPYDTTIIPRIVERMESMGGYFPLINHGKAIADYTYIDNVVESLVLCQSAPESALGKAYNITNDDPRSLMELLPPVLEGIGVKFKTINIPFPIANGLGKIVEKIWYLPGFKGEAPLTPYVAGLVAVAETLDISLARDYLGYQPIVSVDEGIKLYVDWYNEYHQTGLTGSAPSV